MQVTVTFVTVYFVKQIEHMYVKRRFIINFNDYQIPNEYIDKFKVTQRDLKDFEKFWINELISLKEMPNLSKDDITSIHYVLMYAFWSIKAKNKKNIHQQNIKIIFIQI